MMDNGEPKGFGGIQYNKQGSMGMNLSMIGEDLLPRYTAALDDAVQEQFGQLCDNELSTDTFSYYPSVSAVFSSRIEGEPVELESYIKHKRLGVHLLPDYTRKTDDLYDAYSLAKRSTLTMDNLLTAHALLTKHILKKGRQGVVRTGNMFVLTNDGRIEYVAADPHTLSKEIKRLFGEVEGLLEAELSFKEVLYYAAMLHLVFVKIHPFEDGNGRTARLLEKWFMAQKLGDKAWFEQSERYYYEHHHEYDANIRKLGQEYDTLNYAEALPFLLMLPASVGMQ